MKDHTLILSSYFDDLFCLMIVSNTPIGQQGKLKIPIKLSILWCQMLDTGSDVAVSFQSCRLVFRLTLGLNFALELQKALKGMPLIQLKEPAIQHSRVRR